MTQKEIAIINAINCDGLGNHEWGITSRSVNIRHYHGADEDKVVPPHIYVYRECEECHMRNEIVPDYTFRDHYDQVIDLYYLAQEGGEQ